MILYECDRVLEDGSCDPAAMSVDIIGRTRDVITASELAVMAPFISEMCVDRSDFTNTESPGENSQTTSLQFNL